MIAFKASGLVPLKQQLAMLKMKPYERKRFLRGFGRNIARNARRNAKAQRTVEGLPFTPRRAARKKPMMKNLAKTKHLKVYAGPNKVTVTWQNSYMGKIARAQHEGFINTIRVSDFKRDRQ